MVIVINRGAMCDAYYQKDNQEYVKTRYGREEWVQVSGNRKLNGANALFWATLMPLSETKNIFDDVSWNSHIGTQPPGFVKNGSDVFYERTLSQPDSCENIVNIREFYGVKPSYAELTEEFRLLNNLYYDVKTNKYYEILENGECEEVARIADKERVDIKLKYLVRYATAKQMALVLFFDIRVTLDGTLCDNGLLEINDKYKEGSLSYEIWGSDYGFDKKFVCSVLMGKYLIMPRPIGHCGYWPFNKDREYSEFIIGINNFGEQVKFTCNPDKLSNYFGANPGAPHYLTPVFFKKEVLQRYLMQPDLYEVGDGCIKCKSLWHMEIDNHRHDNYISAYLGDLGRDLPLLEHNHWLQYNTYTSDGLSETAIKRDFLATATESSALDIVFRSHYYIFQDKWRERYGWNLFLPLSAEDSYNIESLHIPVVSTQQEFDQQILSLVKVLIDSINVNKVKEQLGNEDTCSAGTGSISVLEAWLSFSGASNYDEHIGFLRNIQEIRSSGVGHRKGKNFTKIAAKLGLTNDNYSEVFGKILSMAIGFLHYLSDVFLSA